MIVQSFMKVALCEFEHSKGNCAGKIFDPY